jgi:hypothetical protein
LTALLNSSEKKLYDLLSTGEPKHIDEISVLRVELFRGSGYAICLGDERDHPAVTGQTVPQSPLRLFPLAEITEKQALSERAKREMNPYGAFAHLQ